MSVYFADDRCEESEHGALGDCARYIPSRHITGIPIMHHGQIKKQFSWLHSVTD